MRLVTELPTLLLLVAAQASGKLRATRDALDGTDEIKNEVSERVLIGDKFHPLACNDGLSSASCDTKWSSLFTAAPSHMNEIVIPCGQCVTVDHVGELTLSAGIDIQGKLVFPDGVYVALRAPHIRVQGELHMYSSKAPNGKPDVKFIITGTDEEVTKFVPADTNQGVCDGLPCEIGKKPIVVAGGKLVIEGLPADFPSWVRLYDVIDANVPEDRSKALVLSNEIKGKWGIGAQLLVTSHTRQWNEQQVRTIFNIYDHTEAGYVVVELDSPIWRPTTIKDSAEFATEVALLARNIVFEGAQDDSNQSHGAHLIIMHTPLVNQKLEGVEFRNFGQQGNLGRYPIHFHLCESVSGSIVSKNLIRESNQRCVVVHGTDDLVVEQNVAYDTSGHCFMTEDGSERGNEFLYNLGALTKAVDTRIPDNGSNGQETDNEPSTFWMTNPSNVWVGNVAAGSEDNGFWMELLLRGPNKDNYPNLVPKYEPLGRFENNVAHSNADKGFRTYPSGYEPPSGASFVGLRSYRNFGDGVFFHNSMNLTVEGGVFADNREQLDFDRSEYITLRNARVIGISTEYKSLMDRQSVGSPCNGDRVIGVQLHTFTRDHEAIGAVLENVKFSGFTDNDCGKSVGIDFDDEIRSGSFDYYTVMSDISQDNGSIPINMCDAVAGVKDIYITDLQGGSSATRDAARSSSVVSNGNPLLTFLAAGQCTAHPDQCLIYCENTCLRTVTYAVDPAGTENYKLKVCKSDDPGLCTITDESYWYRDEGDEFESLMFNTRAERPRYFTATLPKGAYKAEFLNNFGTTVWPYFVAERYEEALCLDALGEGAVTVSVPPVSDSDCNNLIRNGNAEASSTEHTYWLHRRGGIVLRPGQGIGGSNAFATIEDDSTRFDSVAQYFDTRCLSLNAGRQYEITAWVKLVDERSGEVHVCDPDKDDCPQVGLYGQTPEGEFWDEQPVASVIPYVRDGDYQMVQGLVDVTEDIASASSVLFYIRRNTRRLTMFVDNVSVVIPGTFVEPPVSNGGFDGESGGGSEGVTGGGFDGDSGSDPTDGGSGGGSDGESESESSNGSSEGSNGESAGAMTGSAHAMCGNLVTNGDLSIGDTSSWNDNDEHELTLVSPGYRGVSDLALSSFEGGMEQDLKSTDFMFGENYVASGRFRLIGEDGNGIACENKSTCPKMVLTLEDLGERSMQTIAPILGVPKSKSWNILLGGFAAGEAHVGADSIKLHFIDVPDRATLIVDELYVGLADASCESFRRPNSASPSSWAVSIRTYALVAVSAVAALL